jgi:hypothetical protein
MFPSAVIDVAIAMFLAFALTAVAASAIVEWIGNLTRKRAKYLLRGLRNMLDAGDGRTAPSTGGMAVQPAGVRAEKNLYQAALDHTGATIRDLGATQAGFPGGLTALLFDHPLVRAMMQPEQSARAATSRVPPYLPAQAFARALVDTLVPGGDRPTMAGVRTAVEALHPDMAARAALRSLAEDGDDLDAFRGRLERWYDAEMDRVSGWYKRWAQRWIIVVAAALCLAFNLDAYAMAGSLYRDPALRAALVGQAQQGQNCAALPDAAARAACVRDLAATVAGTGAGAAVAWPRGCPGTLADCVPAPDGGAPGAREWLLKLLGLAAMTAAAALGAPFWFDALNRLVNLRLTGKRPEPAG